MTKPVEFQKSSPPPVLNNMPSVHIAFYNLQKSISKMMAETLEQLTSQNPKACRSTSIEETHFVATILTLKEQWNRITELLDNMESTI